MTQPPDPDLDRPHRERRDLLAVAAAPRLGPLQILGRSLFPFAALAILLGTLLWGPWVSLVLTFVWWRVVSRIG